MTRPSQNIDKKLIILGKKSLFKHGIAKLSIRSICMDADINLGMFYYHFKSKENFIKIILTSLVEEVEKFWIDESNGLSNPLEKLRRILFLCAKLGREKRGSFEAIARDIDFSDEYYRNLAEKLHKRWFAFFYKITDECQKEGYLDKTIDVEQLFCLVIGSTMTYSRIISDKHIVSDEEYYKKVNDMTDMVIKKASPKD